MPESTIKLTTKVSGISQLEKVDSLLKSIKSSTSSMGKVEIPSGLSKMESQLTKISAQMHRLESANLGKGLTSAKIGADELAAGIGKSASATNKLSESFDKSRRYQQQLVAESQRMKQTQEQTAQSYQHAAAAQKRAVEQIQKQTVSAQKQPGKVASAFKEVLGMYTLGNLAASGIMAIGSGVRKYAESGLDYISEQQSSRVQWASNARAVNDLLGRKMTDAQAQIFSKRMVKDISNLATSAGNDYKQVSNAALAFYATGAGVSTAGNRKKTLQLTKDMLNLQDAGGMGDDEMARFIDSVAKTLDQDKLTTERLQQLKQFNTNIDSYLEKAHKQRTGKDVKKVGEYSGDDLVNALHMAGMAPGVSNASERMNQSLAGTKRAVSHGITRMFADYESSLAKNLNRSMGGDGKLFSRITGWFNDTRKTQSFTDTLSSKSATAIDVTGKLATKIIELGSAAQSALKPFESSYISGLFSGLKSLGKGIESTGKSVAKTARSVVDSLPHGAADRVKSYGKDAAKMAGQLTAVGIAMRGLTKMPGIGTGAAKLVGQIGGLLGRIPLVGKTLSSLFGKLTGTQPTTAATRMQQAADTMMSAANRMAGVSESGASAGAADALPLRRTQNKAEQTAWYDRMIASGEAAMGAEGSRVARNRTLLGTVKGKTLMTVGKAGAWLASGKTGKILGAVGTAGRGIKYVARNGMIGVNALMSGIDALNVMGTTKAGTLERSRGIGGAVGSGVGSTVGMALGTLVDPWTFGLGTIAGGALGGWLGNKAGSWIGGKVGGGTSAKKRASARQKAEQKRQSKAQAKYLRDNFDNAYKSIVSGAKGTMSAAKAYKLRSAARDSTSAGLAASMHFDDAMNSGDLKAMQKYQGQMAREVKKADTATVKAYSRKYTKAKKSTKSAYSKAYSAAYDYAGGLAGMTHKSRVKYAKTTASSDSEYVAARKAEKKALKERRAAVKLYEKETGEKYGRAKTAKRSSSRSASTATSAATGSIRGGHPLAVGKNSSKKSRKTTSSRHAVSPKPGVRPRAIDDGAKVSRTAKATKSLKSKKVKVSATVSGERKVKSLAKATKRLKSKKAKVAATTTGENKVKSLAKTTKRLKGKKVKVSAATTGENKVKSLSKAAKSVKGKKVKVAAAVSGEGRIKSLKSAIRGLKGKHVSVSARVSGLSAVRALASAIARVHSKHVTITATKHGKLATGTPIFSFPRLAKGTPASTTTRWSANGGVKRGTYLVNDASGDDFVEAFRTKDGTVGLFPKQRNLLVPLDEGTQVLNARDTKRLFPRLEKGSKNFSSGGGSVNMQNTFNITINGGDGDLKDVSMQLCNQIANAIGEKLQKQFPAAEI